MGDGWCTCPTTSTRTPGVRVGPHAPSAPALLRQDGRVRLRYPDVPLKAGHYESVYAALVHPDAPRALWVRTTVKKRPGEEPTGAVWVTWFDEDGVRAGKLDDQPLSAGPDRLTCGPAAQGPDGSRGAIGLDGLSADWDLSFSSRAEPLEHLSPAFLYGAPLPRTKATSPAPDLGVTGTLVVDGAAVDLTGWTGMVGHNWGSEHAARWVWLRVCGLGADGAGWLDAVLGRVQVGPGLLPWKAFGALHLDGKRHHLGGLLRRGTEVEVRPDGARIGLVGPTARVTVSATAPLTSTVGWEYADPSGHRHEVVNCSVAAMELEAEVGGRRTSYTPTRRGVLELGADEKQLDVPLQPFAD